MKTYKVIGLSASHPIVKVEANSADEARTKAHEVVFGKKESKSIKKVSKNKSKSPKK